VVLLQDEAQITQTFPASKPQAAPALLAGVRRVHKRAKIEMVPTSQQTTLLQELQRGSIAKYGVESLLANRKVPLNSGTLRALLAAPCGNSVGSRRLDWGDPLSFFFKK
jgi:hypothetical protein